MTAPDILVHFLSTLLNNLLEVVIASLVICLGLFIAILILQGIGEVVVHFLRTYKKVWSKL